MSTEYEVHGPHDHAVEHAGSGHGAHGANAGDPFPGRIAVMTAVLASIVGTLVGVLAGFVGGAMDTLLARLENERKTEDPNKKLVTVIAGYEADINRFLTMNEGLASRFTTRIHFDSRTDDASASI